MLAAGFGGVVGWTRPVPGPLAALAIFVVHQELVERGQPPAEAVRRARRWLCDPERAGERLPALLTGCVDVLAATPDAELGAAAAALVYRGS
ncbi:hypothetical protein ACFQ9X_39645 [Catenulispora yoronensis]